MESMAQISYCFGARFVWIQCISVSADPLTQLWVSTLIPTTVSAPAQIANSSTVGECGAKMNTAHKKKTVKIYQVCQRKLKTLGSL